MGIDTLFIGDNLDVKEGVMKKTILVVFITLTFSVPCIAEGMEPNGLFGLHGTLWEYQIEIEVPNAGFYAGKVYVVSDSDCVMFSSSSYADFFFFSVFQASIEFFTMNGLLSSFLGIGMMKETLLGEKVTSGIVKKVSDSWTPPEDCIVIGE